MTKGERKARDRRIQERRSVAKTMSDAELVDFLGIEYPMLWTREDMVRVYGLSGDER